MNEHINVIKSKQTHADKLIALNNMILLMEKTLEFNTKTPKVIIHGDLDYKESQKTENIQKKLNQEAALIEFLMIQRSISDKDKHSGQVA